MRLSSTSVPPQPTGESYQPRYVPRAISPGGYAAQRRRALPPRMLAAMCYSIPLVPGAWLLWRERHSRFVRFHAAQSVVFCALIAAGQIALYLLLLLMGGWIQDILVASLAAVVVVGLYLALGLVALLLWLRLVSDCLDGRTRPLPLGAGWAARLERWTARLAQRRP